MLILCPALPALHPSFGMYLLALFDSSITAVQLTMRYLCIIAIPTQPNGGNHTAAFADAARSEAAHTATIAVTKGLALTGYRVLTDSDFFSRVRNGFMG